MNLVYFSNVSNNTHRFVEKLDTPALRIPVKQTDSPLFVVEPYLLVLPTYGGGREGGAVPKQVIKFLNEATNRALIRGVIASGNTNFGSTYCLAGEIVSKKCVVPIVHRFEILGTGEDVLAVQAILNAHLEMETE